MLNLFHHLQSIDRAVLHTDTALDTDDGAGIGVVLYAAIGADIDTDTAGSALLRIDPDRSVHFGDCSFRAGLQTWAFLALNTDGHPRLGVRNSIDLQTGFLGVIYFKKGKRADHLTGLTTGTDIALVD